MAVDQTNHTIVCDYSSLAANLTAAIADSTPYKVTITDPKSVIIAGVTTNNSLGYILSHNKIDNVLLDLRPTDLTLASYTPVDENTNIGAFGTETGYWMASTLYAIGPLPKSSSMTGHHMFWGCSNLKYVDTSSFSDITNAYGMFQDCHNLVSEDTSVLNSDGSYYTLDLSNFSKVTNGEGMFRQCYSLKNLDLTKMTSLVDASNIFLDCTSLETVSTKGLSSVTDIDGLFSGCTSLKTIDLSSIGYTTDVTTVGTAFKGCTKLHKLLNVSKSVLSLINSTTFPDAKIKYMSVAKGSTQTECDEIITLAKKAVAYDIAKETPFYLYQPKFSSDTVNIYKKA